MKKEKFTDNSRSRPMPFGATAQRRAIQGDDVRKILVCFICCILFSYATTGKKMSRMAPNMTKAEVINTLKNTNGFKKVNDYEVLTYTHHLVTG
jgi:hypothetical protein